MNKWYLLITLFIFYGCTSQDENLENSIPIFNYSLDKLPKIRAEIFDSTFPCGHIIFTTKDLNENQEGQGENYKPSVQIIDPYQPWPPLWFASLDIEGQQMITDVKIQPNGNFSFYFNDTKTSFPLPDNKLGIDNAIFNGYVQLDSNFNFIDLFSVIHQNKHDYKVYPDGKRVYLRSVNQEMDLSDISIKGQFFKKNTMVIAEQIEVLNSDNQITLKWNPLEHMDFDEMLYKKYENEIIHSDDYSQVNYSRINSVNIDPFDGNLLVSFRRSDVCMKIDINTGKILWRLGGNKSDFVLAPTDSFFLQHDFKRLKSGPHQGHYSMFSNGNAWHPYGQGLIYEIDENAMTAKVVHRYRYQDDIYSFGQGNYEYYDDGTSLINYGNNSADVEEINFTYVDSSQNEIANYYAPIEVLPYRVVCEQIITIQRPKIHVVKDSNKVMLTASGDFEHYYWSTGDSELTITISDTGSYYVVGQLGIGGVPSEVTHIDNLKNLKAAQVIPVPENPTDYTLKFDSTKTDNIILDLPFFSYKPLKGQAYVDYDNAFFIIEPLPTYK